MIDLLVSISSHPHNYPPNEMNESNYVEQYQQSDESCLEFGGLTVRYIERDLNERRR